MQNIAVYKNVDEYKQARHVENIKPMDRPHAESLILEQERLTHEKMRQKQYQSELITMRHIETNKNVMANFLHIQ